MMIGLTLEKRHGGQVRGAYRLSGLHLPHLLCACWVIGSAEEQQGGGKTNGTAAGSLKGLAEGV